MGHKKNPHYPTPSTGTAGARSSRGAVLVACTVGRNGRASGRSWTARPARAFGCWGWPSWGVIEWKVAPSVFPRAPPGAAVYGLGRQLFVLDPLWQLLCL